jgi:hypothetical protein
MVVSTEVVGVVIVVVVDVLDESPLLLSELHAVRPPASTAPAIAAATGKRRRM